MKRGKLSSSQRRWLCEYQPEIFGLPSRCAYPMNTLTHVYAAKGRAKTALKKGHLTRAEYNKVWAKIRKMERFFKQGRKISMPKVHDFQKFRGRGRKVAGLGAQGYTGARNYCDEMGYDAPLSECLETWTDGYDAGAGRFRAVEGLRGSRKVAGLGDHRYPQFSRRDRDLLKINNAAHQYCEVQMTESGEQRIGAYGRCLQHFKAGYKWARQSHSRRYGRMQGRASSWTINVEGYE